MSRRASVVSVVAVSATCLAAASCGDARSKRSDPDDAGTQGAAGSGAGGSGQAGSDAGASGGASGSGPGGSGPGGSGQGGTGGVGSVPAELAGVWQQTRASAGEYTNGFGQNFDITSGFSAQLKIRENGQYYFAHFASGTSSGCASVSYFDQSVGTAVLEGTTLTLYPEQRRLDVTDCTNSGSRDLPTDPIPFMIGLTESRHFYGGLRTYVMSVSGGPHPLELTQLHREPLANPEQVAQPADFVLGTDGPYQEMQGVWAPSPNSDLNFFDPSTGAFYFPELNGSAHQWLRFSGDNYDAAVALQNVNSEGVCKSDVIYYEQGTALFHVLEDVGGQGSHFIGHTRLSATAARLIVNIRECGEDDGVVQYDLSPLASYYRFILFTAQRPPESITLGCDTFPLSEWQSLLCTTPLLSMYRRS